MRLGVVLVALVGINVYVFFFNRGTAPREILNMQSTSKTFESTRQEALAADVRKAGELVASSSGAKPAARPDQVPRAPRSGERVRARGRPPHPGPARVQDPVRAPARAGRAARPARAAGDQDPVRAPARSEADADAQAGVEKTFAANDTLGPGDGARRVRQRRRERHRRAHQAGRSAQHPGRPEIRRPRRRRRHAGGVRIPAHARAPLPGRARRRRRGQRGRWTARKLEATVEIKIVEAGGTVESSLYESVQKTGESTTLVSQLVELFAWDVNFYIDTHPGDHWKVLIEKQYLGGQFYKYGRVLAAEYGGKVGTFRAFFWAGKDAPRDRPGKYYDEKGQALSKSMLKTPLRFVRISSKFDRKRFHPILHVERAHLGIDYAAPVGTPVWASASGRVVEAGMKHGSGNTVVIAHSNGLATRYYHLSKFARGLRAGQQVRQKDVIGFVGTTGLSTGPHLHFSVTRNGAFVDPSKLAVNRDPPVPDRGAFLDTIRPRIAAMKAIPARRATSLSRKNICRRLPDRDGSWGRCS